MPLLEVDKLTVRFGGLTAVNQVDLSVQAGEIYSVIGPNGAGKTTVFNAITGIYEPTSGTVRFDGRELRKPLSWRVVVASILIGMATGISGAIIASNLNTLWDSAIRRNYTDSSKPFSYAQAWRDAWRHLGGQFSIVQQRSKRFNIVTFDGETVQANVPTREEAEQMRTAFEDIAAGVSRNRAAVESAIAPSPSGRPGMVIIKTSDGGGFVGPILSRETALRGLDALSKANERRWTHRALILISLLLGSVLGTAGTLAVWWRSRRTPDVIAQGGLTRTFQNIRLFRDMTVLENVLVGLDRQFGRHPLTAVLRFPGGRAIERRLVNRACELLEFVGLKEERSMLARNLPYGDQRRLEIARALATEPRLVLLDEPAAGMNPVESDDLMHLVNKIRGQGITVVLIEHHMKLVMNISDDIAVLDHGEKIAEGTPAQVKANPKVIEAYLGKEEVS